MQFGEKYVWNYWAILRWKQASWIVAKIMPSWQFGLWESLEIREESLGTKGV